MCNTNINVQNVNVNVLNRNSVLRASQLNLAGLGLGQNLNSQAQQNWQSTKSLLQVTSR
jgi:hypothetical protein